MSLLSLFIVANIVNVIMSTIKTLVTVNANKYVAAIVSAVNYGFNVYIVVLTVCELPLIEKCLVVGFCNLVGVFVVKWVEEKARKEKLWLVKITVPAKNFPDLYEEINSKNISCTYYNLQKYYVLDCYCEKQRDTAFVTDLCKKYGGKMFASENKMTN